MKHLKNQKGIALSIVMLFVIVLTLLGLGLATFGYYEATSAIREEHLAKAYYSARASVEALAKYLTYIPPDILALENENPIRQAFDIKMGEYVDTIAATGNFAEDQIEGIGYRLQVFKDDSTMQLTIRSTGTSGKFTRSAALRMQYQKYQMFGDGPFGAVDSALYGITSAYSPEAGSGFATNIYGPVKTAQVTTDVMRVDAMPPDTITSEPRVYVLPYEPDYSGLYDPILPGGSKAYTVTSKGLTIVGNTDREVVDGKITNFGTIKYINFPDGLTITGPLLFTGDSPVFIVVDKAMTIGNIVGCSPTCLVNGKFVAHVGDCWLGRVNIIYRGDTTIKISQSDMIRANIVILNESAGIESTIFTSSGNSTISGHIISRGETVEINGAFENNPSMIYAPNADVEIGGAASDMFYGAIICDNFYSNAASDGAFEITYQPITRASLPIWFQSVTEGDLSDGEQVPIDEYYPAAFQFQRWVD